MKYFDFFVPSRDEPHDRAHALSAGAPSVATVGALAAVAMAAALSLAAAAAAAAVLLDSGRPDLCAQRLVQSAAPQSLEDDPLVDVKSAAGGRPRRAPSVVQHHHRPKPLRKLLKYV